MLPVCLFFLNPNMCSSEGYNNRLCLPHGLQIEWMIGNHSRSDARQPFACAEEKYHRQDVESNSRLKAHRIDECVLIFCSQ